MKKVSKKDLEQNLVKVINELISKVNELEKRTKEKSERERMLGQRYG